MPEDAPVTRTIMAISLGSLNCECNSHLQKYRTMGAMAGQGDGSKTLRALWGTEGGAARGPRPRLSLPQVADAAVGLADAHGLDGVTLANVADDLGMTTSALYRYVDSK